MTTRRQVLAAALAAPIAAVPANAEPVLACFPMGVSPRWQSAVAKMKIAAAALDAYYKDVFEPAWEAAREPLRAAEAETKRQLDAIPHYTTRQTYLDEAGVQTRMSTSSNSDVRMALGLADHIQREHDDFRECCRELVTALRARLRQENEINAAAPPPANVGSNIPPGIKVEEKRLEDESYSAFREVANFEAATPSDLIAKVQFLREQEAELDHGQMLADLRRVFGEAPL